MPDGNNYAFVTVYGTEKLFDFNNGQYYKPHAFSKTLNGGIVDLTHQDMFTGTTGT